MQQTNIEWVRNPDGSKGHSWNPIRGRCPVACELPGGEIYCYGHKHYDLRPWLEEGVGEFGALMESELDQPIKRKKPTRIFVCSLFEIFHPFWKFGRKEIFDTIEKSPQHTFIILTKFPENIDRDMPENVWLGATVTRRSEFYKLRYLERAKARIKFVSFEPLLEDIGDLHFGVMLPEDLNWIIVGRLDHCGNKYQPEKSWIKPIVQRANALHIPIFLKNNLQNIWGAQLIQKWPKELVADYAFLRFERIIQNADYITRKNLMKKLSISANQCDEFVIRGKKKRFLNIVDLPNKREGYEYIPPEDRA